MNTITQTSTTLKKRVIQLIRVSTDKQDVARQYTENARLTQKHTLDIVETIEFFGVSGKDMPNHTDMKRIEAALRRPDVDGLLCNSIDRLGRIQRGADFQFITVFEETKKTIWTVRDGVLDMNHPEDWERLMAALIKGGSELREITRRSVGGKRENAANGFLNNASVPYGYRYV